MPHNSLVKFLEFVEFVPTLGHRQFDSRATIMSVSPYNRMWKGTKSLTENVKHDDLHRHIIDGGFLLHKFVWCLIEMFDVISKNYVSCIRRLSE